MPWRRFKLKFTTRMNNVACPHAKRSTSSWEKAIKRRPPMPTVSVALGPNKHTQYSTHKCKPVDKRPLRGDTGLENRKFAKKKKSIFGINLICSLQVPKNTCAKYYSFISSTYRDVPLWNSLNDCFRLRFQTLHLVFSEPIFLPRVQMSVVISWDVLVRFASLTFASLTKYNICFC